MTAGEDSTLPRVELRSGKILTGRVVGEREVQGATLLEISTDFGTLLVSKKNTAKPKGDAPQAPAIFKASAIRLANVEGVVERLAPGAKTWLRVSFTDTYGKRIRFDKIIFPGDTVRTGPKGTADLMLHKDVWVRLAPSTEVVITATERPGATMEVRRGTAFGRVQGKPRGSAVQLQTPRGALNPEDARFGVHAGKEEDGVDVTEGAVSVAGRGTVKKGQAGRWRKTGPWTVRPITGAESKATAARFLRYPDDDFVHVPRGRYRLGGVSAPVPTDLAPFLLYERRAARRTVEGLFMGRTEVSNHAWSLFLAAKGGRTPRGWADGKPKAGTEDHPVVNISQQDATAYARWLWLELPTEAQWEAAARGPKSQRYPWGHKRSDKLRLHIPRFKFDGEIPLEQLGSVATDTDDISPFGCIQMATNAAEYCRSVDNTGMYRKSTNPYGTPDECAVRGVGLSVTGHVRCKRVDPAPAGFRVMLLEEEYDR